MSPSVALAMVFVFGGEPSIPPKVDPSPKTTCGCAFTGTCECWSKDCTCSACRRSKSVSEKLRSDSHSCPSCGTSQFVVHREGAGEHSHKCGRCGTEWWHADPGVTKTYTIPSSTSGCESGNCPSPSAVRRGFIFRR